MTENTLADLIDGLMHQQELAALPAWDGSPLRFTSQFHTPAQLDEATARWATEHAIGEWVPSHMWRRDLTGSVMTLEQHSIATFTADTRCLWWRHDDDLANRDTDERVQCQCVGDYLHMAICDRCEKHWIGDWNNVIENWHDHAFPGWRNLPTLPAKLRGQMGTTKVTPKLQAWLEANYPPAWHTNGAPIRTDRGEHGTRHVPGYSPFGGFDLGASTPEQY